ncbi:MAG: sugar kinase [Candidatus Eisenbacteria bacterium]|nr:sugar kinase [Candidatus Eisenbacteria bacterium]
MPSPANADPILVVGSVALDTITTAHGRADKVLGGSASYFSLVASAFAPVRLVAVVGDDFPADYRALLSARRIALDGLVVSPGRTFHWEGIYEADLVGRRSLKTELNVFEAFRPEIPGPFQDSPIVFLANIDPELQASVLDQMKEPRWVVLDTMDFWMTGDKREALLRLLPRVHVVLVDHGEARLLTGESHLSRAARWIQERGPRVVVVKRGDSGALARIDGTWFWVPPYPEAAVIDPTGAGDSFAAGFLGAVAGWGLDAAGIRRGLLMGAASASFVIERFGAQSLAEFDPAEIVRRARIIRDMGSMERPDPVLDEEVPEEAGSSRGGTSGGSGKGRAH